MRIYIITQEDMFVIPRNIELLIKSGKVNLCGVATVHTKNSLSSKKDLLVKSFGLKSLMKFGLKYLISKGYDFFDLLANGRLLKNKRSIRALTKKYNIPLEKVQNVNNRSFIDCLKNLELDLIVSFSAPFIFKEELLNIPKKGCINLHCSYLPKYSGILPSFWVLYYDEKETGVTIHYMDSKIDNGKILAQQKVEISPSISWLDLIIKTKEVGGNLMVNVLLNLDSYVSQIKRNEVNHDFYHSWPTPKQFKELERKRKLA